MIVDVQGHGVGAVDVDDLDAAYVAVHDLREFQDGSADGGRSADTRLLVEVLRRSGGLVPRALLGGRFVGGGIGTTFIVQAGGPWEERHSPSCRSRLWSSPFTVGLPAEFAEAALAGVAGTGCPVLPPGTLTIDRAGFDVVGSAGPVFGQAGSLLRHAFAAKLAGEAVEAAVRALISTW